MNHLRQELERLLDEGERLQNDQTRERIWESQTKLLIDKFLGPTRINVHSEGYYEFTFAKSHAERVGVLRSVLLAEPTTSTPAPPVVERPGSRVSRPTGSERDVFVSHVSEDQDLALEIADRLGVAGYSVWCYERDTVPGLSYLTQTGEAIAASRVFLLLISVHSLSSHQIDIEVERAHEESKPFIPVCFGISHVEFQARRPLWRQAMGTTTSIELSRDTLDASIPRVIGGIAALGILPSQNPSETLA
jgi:hypothetical protein